MFRPEASPVLLPGHDMARQNPLADNNADDTGTEAASSRLPDSPEADSSSAPTVDVIVVGGGVSGLSAATALHDQGLSVVVLEAKPRLGGRTVTTVMKGAEGPMAVDLGGQWVSSTQPAAMALLQRLGISTAPQYDAGVHTVQLHDGIIRKFSGTIPTVFDYITLANIGYLEWVVDRLCRKDVDKFRPFSPAEADAYDSQTLLQIVHRHTLPWCRSQITQLIAVMTRVVFGCEPQQISAASFLDTCRAAGGLRFLLESQQGGGQEFKIIGGAQQLSQRLADIVGQDNVYTSMPVARITQSTEGVTVTAADGSHWKAKYCILAIPPHLVPRIQHQPPLPPWREQLAQQLPMGHLIKVLVTYSQGFWRQRGYSGQALSSRGPLCTVFDASSADARNPALVGFIGGTQAAIWSSATPADRKQAVLSQIAALFSAEDALTPLDYAERDWAREPYNGGCPVVRMLPGTMSTLAWRLRQPVGRIHFAGTELADVWSGFINGAAESGKRAAEEVLALHCLGSDEQNPLNEPLFTSRNTPYILYPKAAPTLYTRTAPALGVLSAFVALSLAIRYLAGSQWPWDLVLWKTR